VLLPAASMGRGSLAHLGTAVLDFARGALVAALALAFSYGLNAVHDRATDRSTAKNPLAGEVELFPGTMALMWASAAGALLAAMPGGVRPVGCTLLSLFAGAVYSAGPRLKGWPVIGTVLNVGIFLPLMWVAGPSDLRGVLLPITFSATNARTSTKIAPPGSSPPPRCSAIAGRPELRRPSACSAGSRPWPWAQASGDRPSLQSPPARWGA